MIERTVSRSNQINISPEIRGGLFENDDVLLTVSQDGITVSPYLGDELGAVGTYAVKSKFNPFGRLYLPKGVLDAANIERFVVVAIQKDGTLRIIPNKGKVCMACGSKKALHDVGSGNMLCRSCISKAVQKKEGIINEKNSE